MKEITEIDMNKYLVLEYEDVDKYLSSRQNKLIRKWWTDIQAHRVKDKKQVNNYLVLNFDDVCNALEHELLEMKRNTFKKNNYGGQDDEESK